MLNKLKKQNSEGFTIIEVMIVLAIAGLILLIVLLAVPALQRNSRNTTIKSDAATIVGAAATFMSDNEGATPDRITASNGVATLTKGGNPTADPPVAATYTSTIKIQSSTNIETVGDNGEDIPADVTVKTIGGEAMETGTLYLVTGATCERQSTTRSVAILYLLETSNGTNRHCVNS